MDTAGQEKLRALSKQYYKKADGVLLVYDITNQNSFDEIKDYYCKRNKESCKEDVKVMLLGNKTDLESERVITTDFGANFAAENDFIFAEASCLKNENVAGGFETLIELVHRDAAQKQRNESIVLNQDIPLKCKGKSKCC